MCHQCMRWKQYKKSANPRYPVNQFCIVDCTCAGTSSQKRQINFKMQVLYWLPRWMLQSLTAACRYHMRWISLQKSANKRQIWPHLLDLVVKSVSHVTCRVPVCGPWVRQTNGKYWRQFFLQTNIDSAVLTKSCSLDTDVSMTSSRSKGCLSRWERINYGKWTASQICRWFDRVSRVQCTFSLFFIS